MLPTSPSSPIVRKAIGLESVPVRGGTGITKVVHYENFAGGYVVGLSVATHQKGAECGEHNHRGAVEQFFVLDGFGIITVNGVEHWVRPGGSVLVPAGAMHNVAAAPFAPLVVECMLVVAPGHEDDPAPWRPTSID